MDTPGTLRLYRSLHSQLNRKAMQRSGLHPHQLLLKRPSNFPGAQRGYLDFSFPGGQRNGLTSAASWIWQEMGQPWMSHIETHPRSESRN